MFELALSLLTACMLAGLIIIMLKLKADIPVLLQGALNDVGGQLSEIFEKPQVKRAMTVLGKQSGDARASTALKNKVAEKALGQNVLLKKALEYLDITPMEGLELMGDPQIGPVIRNLMAGFQKGGSNFLGGLGGNSGGQPTRGNVPNMS